MNAKFLLALIALVPLSPAAPARAASGNADLRMYCTPDTLRASDDGQWPLVLHIGNSGDFGVFGDSTSVTVQPLDQPGAPARRNSLSSVGTNVSAHDSLELTLDLPAVADRAQVTVTYYAHDRDHHPVELTGSIRAEGSVLDGMYPVRTLAAGRASADMIVVPTPEGSPRGGGLLVIAGGEDPLRSMLLHASRLAKLGITVVLIGPAHGGDDLAGPRARALALAGLDTLAHQPGVLPGLIGVWGLSWGGTTALLVAPERPLRAVVAQSAHYDPWASFRQRQDSDRAEFIFSVGRDSAAWKARSPLARGFRDPKAWKGPTLVLHGEQDTTAPVAAAHAWADAAKTAGVAIEPHFVAQAAHAIAGAESYRWVVRFLNPRLTAPH